MAFAFRPDAAIAIAGETLSAAEAGLVALEVALPLGGHGQAALTLWPGSRFADAAPGDPVTLALGPSGDEAPVLAGTVAARGTAPGAVTLAVLDRSGALSRARLALAFEETQIADIVVRLAQEAGMEAEADGDETLPVYYVEPRRPVWAHLRDLAALAGRDLAADAEGRLLFRRPGAGARHGLRFGADLLHWTLAAGEGPRALGRAAHGSASQSGRWHWIDADPLGPAPAPARIEGILASRDLAGLAAEAAAQRAARAGLSGTLVLSGEPAIRPGDGIALADLPAGDPGPLRARVVRHRLDGQAGFTTRVEVEGGGGGLPGLPGGLP